MKHRRVLKKVGRCSSARASLLRNMSISLLKNERIVTTLPKAVALRPYIEKLITKARNSQSLHSRRLLFSRLRDESIVEKLISDYAVRYARRPGGYCRIMKAGFRRGDCAPIAIIELLDGLKDSFNSPSLGALL